jgi:hypothetical protein
LPQKKPNCAPVRDVAMGQLATSRLPCLLSEACS